MRFSFFATYGQNIFLSSEFLPFFFCIAYRSVGRSCCRVEHVFLCSFNETLECIDRILTKFHENPLIRRSVLTRRRQDESSGCILVTAS